MKIIAYLNKHFVWILIIFILLFLLIKSDLKTNNQASRYESNKEILLDSIDSYKISNGQLVDSKRSLEVYSNELKDQVFIKDDSLKLMIDKFKKVKATVKIVTKTIIKDVVIPFDNPIETPFNRLFSLDDPNYNISGSVSNLGITIDKIYIPNTQRIVIGKRKTGFFKTRLEVSMTNSNSLLTVSDIESQVVTIKNKKFHVIVFAGVDYTFNPTFGVGVGYSLFSF